MWSGSVDVGRDEVVKEIMIAAILWEGEMSAVLPWYLGLRIGKVCARGRDIWLRIDRAARLLRIRLQCMGG